MAYKMLNFFRRFSIRVAKPRLYADVNANLSSTHYDTLEANWGRFDDYEVLEKLGRGKYSEVYKGMNIVTGQDVVIKILKPVKLDKIKREIKILQTLQDSPNVTQLVDIVRDPGSKSPLLILEYIENREYRSFYPSLQPFEFAFYMYEILKGLDFCHSRGIMHRDIKPQNVMIDHSRRYLKIIDWGLAEFFQYRKEYHVRVASRYFKGPELLVDNRYYDYSLDIWSLGSVFAAYLFGKDPFFHGHDNYDQLVKIARVLGTPDLYDYLDKYNLYLDKGYNGLLEHFNKKPWSKFITIDNHQIASPSAVDLLSKMLIYDHGERILPVEAMQHEYFADVRDVWEDVENGESRHGKETAERRTFDVLMKRRNDTKQQFWANKQNVRNQRTKSQNSRHYQKMI